MNLPQVHAFPGRRSGSESCFLLLDPLAGCAADHPLHRSSLELQLDPAAIARVSRADLAHDPNACPILVRLASPGEAAPEGLVQASAVCAVADAGFHKRYICGWLISALTCGELADHLASMCVFDEVPASRFLPIFEPIRLELLAAADSRFMSRRLGPIREWLLPASNGSGRVPHTRYRRCPQSSGRWTPRLPNACSSPVLFQ